jgi:hypothetical protein
VWRLYCCFVRAVTEGGDWAPEMPCAASVTGYIRKGKGKEERGKEKDRRREEALVLVSHCVGPRRRRRRGGEANNGVHALCCRMLSKSMSFKQMSGDHATPRHARRTRPNAQSVSRV